jgi:hypothetical protein
MRFFGFLVVLALFAGVAYWAVALRKPVQRDPVTGQVIGPTAAPSTGGMDPGTTMNNARGAAARIQDEGLQRAADLDFKTAP